MDNIREYVLRIVAAALICGLCQSFFDGKKTRGTLIRMITGLMLAVTVLSPAIELRLDDFRNYLSSLREETTAIVTDGQQIGQNEQRDIITERCQAYILDKAKSLNLELDVQVQLADEQPLHPEGVTLTGAVSPYAQSVLRNYISQTLGIPEEKQRWHIN